MNFRESWLGQRSLTPLLRRVENRPFVRSVGVLAGGAAVGQVVTVIAMPVLSRIYSASQFGHMQYYSLTLLAIVSIGALRYETAVLLPEDKKEAASVLFASLLATVCVVAVVSGAIWALSPTRVVNGDR